MKLQQSTLPKTKKAPTASKPKGSLTTAPTQNITIKEKEKKTVRDFSTTAASIFSTADFSQVSHFPPQNSQNETRFAETQPDGYKQTQSIPSPHNNIMTLGSNEWAFTPTTVASHTFPSVSYSNIVKTHKNDERNNLDYFPINHPIDLSQPFDINRTAKRPHQQSNTSIERIF